MLPAVPRPCADNFDVAAKACGFIFSAPRKWRLFGSSCGSSYRGCRLSVSSVGVLLLTHVVLEKPTVKSIKSQRFLFTFKVRSPPLTHCSNPPRGADLHIRDLQSESWRLSSRSASRRGCTSRLWGCRVMHSPSRWFPTGLFRHFSLVSSAEAP